MRPTSEVLSEYLRNVFYGQTGIGLDVEALDEEFVAFGKGLVYFAQCLFESNDFAKGLAEGKFDMPPPARGNMLVASLKSLHASLNHLTWQAQQVAKGDYTQRVDFMGDFSNAFNTMIEQLAERQSLLEQEVTTIRRKSDALEQSNRLLTIITQDIPQQIIVIATDTQEILFQNDMAHNEMSKDEEYLTKILGMVEDSIDKNRTVVQYIREENESYLSVSSYVIEWGGVHAEAFVINDVSDDMTMIKELEDNVYKDSLTQVYNRRFGMLTLSEWLKEKRSFSLVFADLDNLKYINDQYGHAEGDNYIITAANGLKTISSDVVVCRLGGDEFMMLVPNIGYDEAYAITNEICQKIQYNEDLKDKDYFYSFSFGVVYVDEDTKLPQSEILALADELMYENKKEKKANRRLGYGV